MALGRMGPQPTASHILTSLDHNSGGHISEGSLRREPGVEPHGAPRLAAVGPTCGGERRREANPASLGLGRRSASPPPHAKVCSGRMRLIPPRHSAWRKDLMCAGLLTLHNVRLTTSNQFMSGSHLTGYKEELSVGTHASTMQNPTHTAQPRSKFSTLLEQEDWTGPRLFVLWCRENQAITFD